MWKLELWKKVFFYKKISSELIFLYFLNSIIFWHKQMTLKVQYLHFLRPWCNVNSQKIAISINYSWFDQKPCFLGPSKLKTPWSYISSLVQFSTVLWLYYAQLRLMLTIVNVHEKNHVKWEYTICTMKNDVGAHGGVKSNY